MFYTLVYRLTKTMKKVLFVMMAMVALTACSSSNDDDKMPVENIIGKWSVLSLDIDVTTNHKELNDYIKNIALKDELEEAKKETYEFNEDGTMRVYYDESNNDYDDYKYSLKGNKLTIINESDEEGEMDEVIDFGVSLANNKLTITDLNPKKTFENELDEYIYEYNNQEGVTEKIDEEKIKVEKATFIKVLSKK